MKAWLYEERAFPFMVCMALLFVAELTFGVQYVIAAGNSVRGALATRVRWPPQPDLRRVVVTMSAISHSNLFNLILMLFYCNSMRCRPDIVEKRINPRCGSLLRYPEPPNDAY